MNISEFKNQLPLLNEIIYFDNDEYLREKSSDLPKLKQFIKDAEILLESTQNDDERYFIMGTLGNLYRIYGESHKSIECLEYCINYASMQGNIEREIISLIRLGEALKYEGHHMKALETFNEVIEKCGENNETSYLDFAFQHKGKCLLEMKRIDEAEKCLMEALRLRKLISPSKELILCNEKIHQMDRQPIPYPYSRKMCDE